MKRLLIALLAMLAVGCQRPLDHPEIRAVLAKQAEAWNRGDFEAYMQGYWKSDELAFASPRRQIRGWKEVQRHYRESYPACGDMGRIAFENIEIASAGQDAAEVSGRYRLKTPQGLRSGRLYLNLRRIDGAWVIVKHYAFED